MFRKSITLLALCIITVALTLPKQQVYAIDTTLSDSAKQLLTKYIPAAREQTRRAAEKPNYAQEIDDFIVKIEDVANRLGMEPDSLVLAMGLETGYTFDPREANNQRTPFLGLIQIGPPAAQTIENVKAKYGITTNCSYNNLTKLTRVQQMDCVYVNGAFWLSKSQTKDMATIYASINFPKAVPYGPDQCWYTEGEANNYYTNNANLNPDGYRNSQGKLCVTKNTVITRMYNLAKAKGYNSNKTFTTSGGNNNASDLSGPDVEEYLKAMQDYVPAVATKAQIEAALAEINDRQDTIITNAVNSSFALPTSFFQGCTFSDSNTGLITTGANPTSLVACIKSVLNYVFVIAVLYVIVSLAASNLGVAITSGANGGQPVANARKQLERSLIGLFLIGAPYLLLDLFASSTGLFNLVALDKLPNFQSFTLTIDSGLPASTPGDKEPLILGYLFGNNNQTNTEFGASIDGLQAGGSARGGDERSVNPDLCIKSPDSCKILNVPYVSQVFNADGKATPNGNSACAAASTVMAVAYIKPEIYDNSTGKNNAGNTATGVPGNLSLRENIFYANTYLASKSYTTNCEYVMTDSGKESTKVNGVFSITGVPTKRKIVSTGEIVRVCDGSDRTHIVNQYFPLVGLKGKIATFNTGEDQYYNLIRQEIDANRPVIFRFEDSNLAPFGHYIVIKGYVKGTTSFVVNDPWGRFSRTQFSPSTNTGNGAIYNIDSLNGKAIITMSK